ncbi:MAG: acylphosphatase [Candidatus Aminicenantes bacterium]|nr:acylphosphatase [Candidatus Aminicenantes bacterium]
MESRVHMLVKGRVQGVSFRYYTQKWALSLGINGWVRNLADGRVEILVEGKMEDLEELVARTKKGPPIAYVEKVEVDWQPYRGEFSEFRVRNTEFI